MNVIEATSACDLLQKLRKINIQVPHRTEGRTTEHCETWVICNFLAIICRTPLLEYPIWVEHDDRPDFVFIMQSGRTGIEIVEAVPQAKAEADAYSEHKGILTITGIPRFRAGEPSRSKNEIEAIAKGTAPDQNLPWMGDSIEQGWIDAMLYFSQLKAGKFQRPGFKKHDNNWLLIYDNWRPAPADGDMVMATEALGKQLLNQNWVNPFGRIFVLRPEAVWEFRNPTIPVKYRVKDL